MEPGLRNGDTVLIDQIRNQVRRGAIVADRVSDNLFVKRLGQTPDNKWRYRATTIKYKPLALAKDDV